MAMLSRAAVLVLSASALTACAPSGYSVQARNNYPQAVELRVMAQKDDQARVLESTQVAAGQNVTYHTKAERDEKVRLEARPAAEPQSAPAVYKMIVGLSKVVINPNPEAAKDSKQPKVTVREER
jgi:hypothetical protein